MINKYSFLAEQSGKVFYNHSLKNLNWFKVGGNADALFMPLDITDLQVFLKNKPANIPFIVLGVGSNILIRDGGFHGVVVKLINLNQMVKHTWHEIKVGAGCLNISVANFAKELGLGELEFLSGIPGSIGGAIFMNAGAFNSEFKDICLSVEGVDLKGELHQFTNQAMKFSYRKNSLTDTYIFTSTILKGVPSNNAQIVEKMDTIKNKRADSQPAKVLTGGSTFTNPVGSVGFKAWELIDKAGLRGYKIGGASFSDKHCNFIINDGSATASNIEDLITYAISKIDELYNIKLHPEIKIIGEY